LDIYRPGDFVKTSPMGETIPPIQVAQPVEPISGGSLGYMQQPLAGTPINFAPVFKIMNGGSDFSTGNPSELTNIDGGNNMNDAALGISSMTSPQPIQVKQDGGSKKDDKKEETTGGGIMDFGKMLIKKIGM